jgi:hypothetical protein
MSHSDSRYFLVMEGWDRRHPYTVMRTNPDMGDPHKYDRKTGSWVSDSEFWWRAQMDAAFDCVEIDEKKAHRVVNGRL